MPKTSQTQLLRVNSSKTKLKQKDADDIILEEELEMANQEIKLSIKSLQHELELFLQLHPILTRAGILESIDESTLVDLSRLVDDRSLQDLKKLEKVVCFAAQCQATSTPPDTIEASFCQDSSEASVAPDSSEASPPMDLSSTDPQKNEVWFILNPC